MAATSKAIRELLERKGLTPTGDSKVDLLLAQEVMNDGNVWCNKIRGVKNVNDNTTES